MTLDNELDLEANLEAKEDHVEEESDLTNIESFVEIYIAGACTGNPGKGGYGVVIVRGNDIETLYGWEEYTTNNIMDLTAVIRGIRKLKENEKAKVYTHSEYIEDTMNYRIKEWKENRWRNDNNKTPANIDLWKKIDYFCSKNSIEWLSLKTHGDSKHYFTAKGLATENAKVFKRKRW